MAGLSRVRTQDVRLARGRSLAVIIGASLPPSSAARREATAAALRALLSAVSGQAPETFRFAKSAQGKPFLAGGSGISFSLSHSAGRSLVALSLSGEVGCDIEDRFGDDDVMGLCAPVLHASEFDAMERLSPPERQDAFRRYWVRKEAVLKAAGSGFLRDPRCIITGLDQPHAMWVGEQGPDFAIHERRIDAGCAAAVASMDAACDWHLLDG